MLGFPFPPAGESDPVASLLESSALARIDAGPASTKVERFLDKMGNVASSANDPQNLANVALQTTKEVLDQTGALKSLEGGINAFSENLGWLMKGLDEVASLHPAVKVVVLVFKAVYTMEVTRRENDKRILSLYVEMKGMVAVLIELRSVTDPKSIGPDGKTLGARIQTLCQNTADDIQNCANACEAYAKKRLIVKVLKGHSWESQLVGFVSTFTRRKDEFRQALAMHTARTVDAIQSAVGAVQSTLDEIAQRTDLFMKLFELHLPKAELAMRAEISQKGGIEFVQQDSFPLWSLYKPEDDAKDLPEYTPEQLKADLGEDIDHAITKNLDQFERKLFLQQAQLQEGLMKPLQEIMHAINEGPHDRIKDPELREIWKDMNWRRNVRTKLFVMTIRDHFKEMDDNGHLVAHESDEWALKFIDTFWLQPISEAFDDDASGYVTVAELNQFMSLRPINLGWSLPHWIAYWAIGWQLSAQKYCKLIHRIFSTMHAMIPSIPSVNGRRIPLYLTKVWQTVCILTTSLRVSDSLPEYLLEKFSDFIEYEEKRIEKNLETVKYVLDGVETVSLAAGPGRIEKSLFPLIYLLLSRDLKLFKLAQTKYIHRSDFVDAAYNYAMLYRAAMYRVSDLSALFSQRQLDSKSQFKIYACGMFDYFNDPTSFDSMSEFQNIGAEDVFTKEELDAVSGEQIPGFLKHAPSEPSTMPYFRLDDPIPSPATDVQATGLARKLEGLWCGYDYGPEKYPYGSMSTRGFIADGNDKNSFSYQTSSGSLSGDYSLTGLCNRDENGGIGISFQVKQLGYDEVEYFVGRLEEDGSIIGYYGAEEDVSESKHQRMAIYRRVSPEIMRHRPGPEELKQNKPHALWKFALSVVQAEVQRRLWSRGYFKERCRLRKLYIRIRKRTRLCARPMTEAEYSELGAISQALTPDDVAFALGVRERLMDVMPQLDEQCASCEIVMFGSCLLCLECPVDDKSIVRACNLQCFDDPLTTINDPHEAHHHPLKVRTILSRFDLARYRKAATAVLDLVAKREVEEYKEEPSNSPLTTQADLEKQSGNSSSPPDPISTSATTVTIQCNVCQGTVTQSYWCCVMCADYDLCDDCEDKMLLACYICGKPYTQPEWYYGAGPNDNFTCYVCVLKGTLPENLDKSSQHTYSHPLVRYKSKDNGSKATDAAQTIEERIAALEAKSREIDMKLDRVVGISAKLEATMATTLEAVQRLTENVKMTSG